MHLLMLFILISLLLVSYKASKKSIIAPFFLACLSVFVSYCVILFNYFRWDVVISDQFVIYVTTALVSFGIGSILANYVVKVKSSNSSLAIKRDERKASTKSLYVCAFISLITTCLYIFKMISAAGSVELRQIYLMVVNEDYSPGFLFNQMKEITIFIAYISIYRIIKEFILSKRRSFKNLFFMMVPIILFFVLIAFGTDRNILIRFVIFSICIFVTLNMQYIKSKKSKIRMIFWIMLIGIAAIVVFYLYGKSKNYTRGLFDSLSIYGGSGLYNFNLWLSDYNGAIYYGQSTFSTFLNEIDIFLNPLGIHLPDSVASRFDDFIKFTSSSGYNYGSNIYSAFRPFVEDFGYFGMIIYPLLYGFFYQALYNFAKRSSNGFWWILYGVLIYSVIFFPVAEQGIRRWHLGLIYELFWVTAIYYAVFRKKTKKIKLKPIGQANNVISQKNQ